MLKFAVAGEVRCVLAPSGLMTPLGRKGSDHRHPTTTKSIVRDGNLDYDDRLRFQLERGVCADNRRSILNLTNNQSLSKSCFEGARRHLEILVVVANERSLEFPYLITKQLFNF